jgi:L-fucose mutarotase
MLRYGLTHPLVLQALACAGHGARLLLADGNYPFSTGAPAAARRVYLNLAPGCVTVDAALLAIAGAVTVESAILMHPGPDSPDPPVHSVLAALLPDAPTQSLGRTDFYRRPFRTTRALSSPRGSSACSQMSC